MIYYRERFPVLSVGVPQYLDDGVLWLSLPWYCKTIPRFRPKVNHIWVSNLRVQIIRYYDIVSKALERSSKMRSEDWPASLDSFGNRACMTDKGPALYKQVSVCGLTWLQQNLVLWTCGHMMGEIFISQSVIDIWQSGSNTLQFWWCSISFSKCWKDLELQNEWDFNSNPLGLDLKILDIQIFLG